MKNYFRLFICIVCLCTSVLAYSQISKTNASNNDTIEGLSIYPNPVNNGKLYISTLKNLSKDIEIFDVLGKKVYTTSLFGNTMDVSKLNAGVYIIKITENNIKATRKLVIR